MLTQPACSQWPKNEHIEYLKRAVFFRHLTDYYVRLGDYDNDDASTTTYDEDQQVGHAS